jgi:hypothetical protein
MMYKFRHTLKIHPVYHNMMYKGVFLKCAEILPTRLWDNAEKKKQLKKI